MGWIMLNGIHVWIVEGATITDYGGLVTKATADMINFRQSWGNDEIISVAKRGDEYTLRRLNGRDEIIMGDVPVAKGRVEFAYRYDEEFVQSKVSCVWDLREGYDTLLGFIASTDQLTFGSKWDYVPYRPDLWYVIDNKLDEDLMNRGFKNDIRGVVSENITSDNTNVYLERWSDIDPATTQVFGYEPVEDGSACVVYRLNGAEISNRQCNDAGFFPITGMAVNNDHYGVMFERYWNSQNRRTWSVKTDGSEVYLLTTANYGSFGICKYYRLPFVEDVYVHCFSAHVSPENQDSVMVGVVVPPEPPDWLIFPGAGQVGGYINPNAIEWGSRSPPDGFPDFSLPQRDHRLFFYEKFPLAKLNM